MSIANISKVSRNSYVTDLVDAIDKQVFETRGTLNEIENSMIILSTEETIKAWETFFNLQSYSEQTLKERVERVLSFFNSRGFFTESFLKEQAKIFTNGEIEVIQDYLNYHFLIKFVGSVGVPTNLQNFSDMINLNKPCKLTWDIVFTFRIWEFLKTFTWQELSRYTWDEVRSLANLDIKNK